MRSSIVLSQIMLAFKQTHFVIRIIELNIDCLFFGCLKRQKKPSYLRDSNPGLTSSSGLLFSTPRSGDLSYTLCKNEQQTGFRAYLVILCVPEAVNDPLGVVVQDLVVEILVRVARVDPQGDGRVVEGHVRCVVLKRANHCQWLNFFEVLVCHKSVLHGFDGHCQASVHCSKQCRQ